MKEELESLHKNQTWELVENIVNQKIVGNKSIVKKNDMIRFNARLVEKALHKEKVLNLIHLLLFLMSLYDLELE